MTHDELVRRGRLWLKNNNRGGMRFPIILSEYRCFANSEPDVIGFNHYLSAVIECKVSRSDFLSDHKKKHRQFDNQLGNLRYYLCPADMIEPSEIQGGWGLLYCHPHKITIEKESKRFPPSETRPQEYQVMYSIIRRMMSTDGHDKTLSMLRGSGKAGW